MTYYVAVDEGNPGSAEARTGVVAVLGPTDSRDTLKALRETLCRAQSGRLRVEDMDRINRLIEEIDRQRPLGPDGKHGDLHTPTCGCDL